ncbi:MAG TPA: dienelactone hydrolase family protein, partial [Bacillales bacterium]|nr:dienelactone hydrolase family protein [Bacillales bacterium]
DRIIAVGYSNGANIAASLLFHYENSLAGSILFHPMVPRRGVGLPHLHGTPVFISAGRNDPICPPEETKELAEVLGNAGADVDVCWQDHGHQLSPYEVAAASDWYEMIIG